MPSHRPMSTLAMTPKLPPRGSKLEHSRKQTGKRVSARASAFFRVATLFIVIVLLSCCFATAQDSGSAAAAKRLRESDVAGALDLLGPVADARKSLPETDADAALSAAAGGLFRALAQLDADEQFDLLSKWTLPSGERKHVRMLTAIVPQDAPPQVFARVIGERPRDSTFLVADVNGVRGLFSSGWLLVASAEEAGRLRRLVAEVEPLVAQNVPGADVLLLLAQIADRRADVEVLKTSLSAWVERAQAGIPDEGKAVGGAAQGLVNVGGTAVNPEVLAIAVAALKHPELRGLSEQMLDSLVSKTLGHASPRLRPFLRVAHATAVQLNRGESGVEVLRQNRLKYWLPVSGKTSVSSASGSVDAMWLVHEDHILHLAGAGQDGLMFRYPLTGEFNFLCETQEGGPIGTDGGLSYGGLYFEALGSSSVLTVRDADALHLLKRPCPFVRHEARPVFNRVSIRIRPASEGVREAAQFLSNLHPMWTDELAGTSPWLGLSGIDEKRPIFRNLKLTGSPVIPREVKLTDGNQLRGWLSSFYGETQPTFHAGGEVSIPKGTVSATESSPIVPVSVPEGATVSPDWSIVGGVIVATKQSAQPGRTSQSVLRYQRPLLDGESIAYEFHFQPGASTVHPALGRLAFLIESGGVRIHWMTDGDREWSGLPEDNSTLEPLSRRGGRELPLKENDWNAVTLARADGKVRLTLNETLIYERAIDFGGDLQFGLFRDRTQDSVKVRNVIMTGDWPETVPPDCLKNPTIVIGDEQAAANRQAQSSTIGEQFLGDNAAAVRVAASVLAPEDRFEFLSNWIFPNEGRETFRTVGAFTPVNPPPIELVELLDGGVSVVQRPLRTEVAQRPLDHRGKPGGGEREGASELVSPVFDLLDLAKHLGRLDELRARIESVSENGDAARNRGRASMLALVCLELGDHAASSKAADRLFELLPKEAPNSLAKMWPETLLVWRSLTKFGVNESVGDVLSSVFQQRTMQGLPTGVEFWQTQIAGLHGRHDHVVNGGSNETFDAPLDLNNWISAPRMRARTRGVGAGEARWLRVNPDEVHHVSGHQEELLLYRSPLRGNFEITCEVGGHSTTQVLAGGLFHGPNRNPSILETGSYRRGVISRDTIDPPFTRIDRWVKYRAAFRDGVCTVSLNGRPVSSRQLLEHSDPWFGIHCWYRNSASFRDVRISGSPVVPGEVVLSNTPDLDGWMPYHEESIGSESARWIHSVDPDNSDSSASGIISGRLSHVLNGTVSESLLTYQRPLLEDGTISYDFYYEPGRFETHPALDRIAFLLRPDGVKLHWVTDSPYDSSDISPDNEFAGTSRPLPLLAGDWNRLVLHVVGSRASLALNGEAVFAGDIDSSNRRTFGLFHYVDNTEVRVRNVVMRGNWPKTVPVVAEQELADRLVPQLDAERKQLPVVFEHSFGDGIPAEFFEYRDTKGGAQIEQRLNGLRITRPALNAWTSTDINTRFEIRGDFDIEAEFDDFRYSGENDAIAMLVIKFDDPLQQHCRALRNRSHHQQRQLFQASRTQATPDGKRAYAGQNVTWEANSGRLRLSRRGDEVFYLVAEGDSQNFRLFGRETITAADSVPGAIDLTTIANGDATVGVLWKSLRIAAKELLLPPDPSEKPLNEIFVMNEDGSDLRAITEELPIESGRYGKGSPDWSPDGKHIAFDMYSGMARSSASFIINLDGTGLVDLGEGIMPTFGPDGQRLAFTWSGHGMALMDRDGENREVLTSDGWGAQFSPDGKWVAYQSNERIDGAYYSNITIIDVTTKERRVLLEGDHSKRYSQIYWNMEWSPDSQHLCFKGGIRGPTTTYETATTSIDGSTKAFRVLTTDTTDTDFGWHPDGTRILLSKPAPGYRGTKLFICDLKTGAIDLLETQPLNMPNHSGLWSPDGKQIAFVSRRDPQPVPWKPLASR